MKKFISLLVFCLIGITPAFAFSDVTVDFWGYDQIDMMYKSGIISGFEDGTFRPNEKITREQSAAILTNFFELEETVKHFEDVNPGYWSEKYNNSVSPYMPIDEVDGKYYFRPQDFATRVEIAETVSKIIGLEAQDDDLAIIENFNDKDKFLEKDKEYIAMVANNKIMVGDDKSEFRPNDTITRAEFCALIYNIYLTKNNLKDQALERTVMTINGENISCNQFNIYFGLQKKVYEAMFGGPQIWTEEVDGVTLYDVVKDATKEGIISEKVRIQKAKEFGIELDEATKNEVMEYANSEVGLEICEFYGITTKELYNINSDGMLIYELAKVMYENTDHTGHLHNDINAPVESYIYDARHILLSTEDLSAEDKEKVRIVATNLLNRVLSGEDFGKLANEYSTDPGSNKNGGLYENVYSGQFVAEFEEAALALNDGEICDELIESDFGYHIIKLEKKVKTTKELTEDEKQEIMSLELEELAKEWINNAVVNINDEIYKSL